MLFRSRGYATDGNTRPYRPHGTIAPVLRPQSPVTRRPHTITVSDLSEAGVRTSIRYGNSAESCTMTSAPNYTEEGQYTVYYEITYTYQNVSMTENGVANVWLRDTQASEDGKCTPIFSAVSTVLRSIPKSAMGANVPGRPNCPA